HAPSRSHTASRSGGALPSRTTAPGVPSVQVTPMRRAWAGPEPPKKRRRPRPATRHHARDGCRSVAATIMAVPTPGRESGGHVRRPPTPERLSAPGTPAVNVAHRARGQPRRLRAQLAPLMNHRGVPPTDDGDARTLRCEPTQLTAPERARGEKSGCARA